ncbi:MAG: glycoside hydrolase family 9 protein [Bacteroidota bacterium]
MKRLYMGILIWLLLPFCFAQNPFIHVDQFGYYSNGTKVAVLSNPDIGFNSNQSYSPSSTLDLIDVNTQQSVFSASPQEWNNGDTDGPSGDKGWWLDFSSFQTPGRYYWKDVAKGIESPPFNINENPYLDVLKASFKIFYYNRCNLPKVQPYAGANWTDGDNFDKNLQDKNCRFIYDQGNASREKDLSGGWFDAGDYNKYVTFTHTVVHNFLTAYENQPSLFTDDWNIPESGNGKPDLLDELKWELDWLIKMVNSDGSVQNKVGAKNYSENAASPPSSNTDPRYYGPTCTSASAVVASNFAHAALVFKDIPGWSTYADELKNKAVSTFSYVLPFFTSNTLETDCDDGSIVAGDSDQPVDFQVKALVSAAIYLWELTGDNTYHQFVKDNATTYGPLENGFWGPYQLPLETALLHYTNLSGADASLKNNILSSAGNEASNNWNGYFGMSNNSLYRDFMPAWSYHWGSSQAKASYGALNLEMAKYGLGGDVAGFQQKAEEMIHAFHGVNPFGMVYLSNMYQYGATKSINEIYHTWFNDQTIYDHALNSSNGPAPGFLVGGPNKDFSVSSLSPPYGQPDAKAYLDFNTGWPDNSWELSEPAIYYQAAYIRLLSGIVALGGFGPTTDNQTIIQPNISLQLYPNPAASEIAVSLQNATGQSLLTIMDVMGRQVRHIQVIGNSTIVPVADLPSGTYVAQWLHHGLLYNKVFQRK